MISLKKYVMESFNVNEEKYYIHSDNGSYNGIEAKFYTPKNTLLVNDKNDYLKSVNQVLSSDNAVIKQFHPTEALAIIGIVGDKRNFVLFEPTNKLNLHHYYNQKLSGGKHIFIAGLSKNSNGYKDQYITVLIDLKLGMLYFMDNENKDEDKLIFEKKGNKIDYIKSYDRGMFKLNTYF